MDILLRNFLTSLILLPIAGAIVLRAARTRLSPRWTALTATLLTFVLSLLLLLAYDWHDPAGGDVPAYAIRDGIHPGGVVQLVQRIGLISPLHLEYFVGIDGLSLPLVLLTTLICPLVCVASWKIDPESQRYFTLVLLTEAAILATLFSLNLAFFALFFAIALLPIGMLIGRWGGPRKQAAQSKFFIFMLLSTLALLVAVIGVFRCSGSLDLIALAVPPANPCPPTGAAKALFLILMAALVIRLAAFPFHTWLVDVHAAVSAPISMMLSALVQTTGAYGVFRIARPLFPDAAKFFWVIFAALGIANIFFGALCAMSRGSLKRLASLILLPQAGFILLGAAVMTPAGAFGATFLIVSGGISSAILHVLLGILADRARHPVLSDVGSGARNMAVYDGFSIVGFLTLAGLPMLGTFVGQLLVLLGVFQAAGQGSPLLARGQAGPAAVFCIAILGCIGILLITVSLLLALQRILLSPRRAERRGWPDLDQREIAILTTLTAVALLLGILPATIYFNFTRTTVEALQRLIQ
jgi:NADH-quinone oxidoreductase subunit M